MACKGQQHLNAIIVAFHMDIPVILDHIERRVGCIYLVAAWPVTEQVPVHLHPARTKVQQAVQYLAHLTCLHHVLYLVDAPLLMSR